MSEYMHYQLWKENKFDFDREKRAKERERRRKEFEMRKLNRLSDEEILKRHFGF